jgi:hypothetical protein
LGRRTKAGIQLIKSIPPKDTLLLYISASHSAVSAALVLEREIEGSLKQVPVYFVLKALSGLKLFYSELEKIAYAVIMSSRKLATTSKPTRLWWSPTSHCMISSTIEKLRVGSVNGLRSYRSST